MTLFLGIGLIAQLPTLANAVAADLALEIILAITGFLLMAIAQGAAVYAVAKRYLGAAVSLGDCFGRARQQALPLIIALVLIVIIVVLLAFSVALIAVVIGIPCFLYLLWRLIMMVFYPQAIMVENQTLRHALRRSGELVQGNWWRVFGITLVYVLILLAVAIGPLIMSYKDESVVWEIILALVSAIGMPWITIGNTLLYFDLRVRKEGLTLEVLKSELSVAPTFKGLA